jgi:hypothetical protein
LTWSGVASAARHFARVIADGYLLPVSAHTAERLLRGGSGRMAPDAVKVAQARPE